METILKQNDQGLRVLAVWEPMLATDWSRPSGIVQSRISDPRVIQFWDKDHLVANTLDKQLSSQPSCCRRDGVLWDLVALYPEKVQWGAAPAFIDGPVVSAADAVQRRLLTLRGMR